MRRIFSAGRARSRSRPGVLGCNDHQGLLSAKQIEDRAELVGGPVAMADVGDFLLQNDKIKVNILGAKDSPGPGVFGGSIVDIDVAPRSPGLRGRPGPGSLRRAVPRHQPARPVPRGSSRRPGAERRQGRRRRPPSASRARRLPLRGAGHPPRSSALLSLLFPGIKTEFCFRTDYILLGRASGTSSFAPR